jgi:nucleotide-binding universal stress UspA family protein
MLNNLILVPTDFSQVCHNAIEHAVNIAQASKFKVLIYHVINKESLSLFKGENNINQAVENKLAQIVEEFKKLNKGLEIDFAFEEGSIFDLIHEKASKAGANFIILGTHGKKGLQHLFGSYALKVITKANVPTLVVQKKNYYGYSKILMPINSFTEARQKVQYAISLAKRFNSTITIFKEKVSDSAEMSRIEIISRQIAEAFQKSGVNYEIELAESAGDSARIVIDYAVEKNMDLILIVTEPQIGSLNFSLAPWSEKIIFNEAQIPVICINPVEFSQAFFDL